MESEIKLILWENLLVFSFYSMAMRPCYTWTVPAEKKKTE